MMAVCSPSFLCPERSGLCRCFRRPARAAHPRGAWPPEWPGPPVRAGADEFRPGGATPGLGGAGAAELAPAGDGSRGLGRRLRRRLGADTGGNGLPGEREREPGAPWREPRGPWRAGPRALAGAEPRHPRPRRPAQGQAGAPGFGALGAAAAAALAAAAAAAGVAAARPGARGRGLRGNRRCGRGRGRGSRLWLWLRYDAAGHGGHLLVGALGRAAGPLAQPLDVPRLREVERRQQGHAHHRGDPGVGADFLDDLRQGSNCRTRVGLTRGRWRLSAPARSTARPPRWRARRRRRRRRAPRCARTRFRTQSGSSGGWTAQTIFSAGVGWGRSPGLNSSSWIFSPGRRPTTSMAMSTSGSKPGEPDHVGRQVDDLHRIAHLEHEDLAARGQLARADDQLNGLRDRHEVAGHHRSR